MTKILLSLSVVVILAGCTVSQQKMEIPKQEAVEQLSQRVPLAPADEIAKHENPPAPPPEAEKKVALDAQKKSPAPLPEKSGTVKDAREAAERKGTASGKDETEKSGMSAGDNRDEEGMALAKAGPSSETVRGPQPEGAPAGPVPLDGLSAWKGECLVYEVKWNFSVLGQGLIACQEEKSRYGLVYHMVGVTVPVGLMAKLGLGYNRVDSYVDRATLQPYFFYSYTHNAKAEEIVSVEFSTRKKEFSWRALRYRSGVLVKTKQGVISYKDKVYDGMTVFYLLRRMELDTQRRMEIPVGITKLWDLRVDVMGKKVEDLPVFGTREVYEVQPTARSDEGLFKKGNLTIWMTADAQRIPVSFFGKIALGTGRMALRTVRRLDDNVVLDRKKIAELLGSP